MEVRRIALYDNNVEVKLRYTRQLHIDKTKNKTIKPNKISIIENCSSQRQWTKRNPNKSSSVIAQPSTQLRRSYDQTKHTRKHEDGRFRKLEFIYKQVTHAFRVIDAPFKLVARVPVRYPDDHGLLTPVGARRGARWNQRVRQRGVRARRRRVGRRRRLRRDGTWVGYVSDGMAEGTADGSGARRQLQRRAAVGAIDQHMRIHGCLGGWEW